MVERIKINLITLDCGHTVSSNQSSGYCSECKKSCCQKCLQVVNGHLLCPICYLDFVSHGDSHQ